MKQEVIKIPLRVTFYTDTFYNEKKTFKKIKTLKHKNGQE